MRRASFTLLLLLCGLALPASADAGAIHLTGTAGPSAEVFPQYRADPGERNKVHVTLGRHGVTIVDTGVRFIRAEKRKDPLCRRRGRRKFYCPGTFFVDVRLGDRNDSLRLSPSAAGSAPAADPADATKLAEPDFSDDEGAPDATSFIYGGDGNDTITGSSSDDDIYPGAGRDRVSGRGGRDTIVLGDDGSPDTVHGDGGRDSVYFQGKRPVTVDLAAGTGGGDKLAGIERVHGTAQADTLLGTERGDALYGEGGADTIDGRGGNDFIVADSPFGDDGFANHVTGGDGDDVIDVLRVPKAAGSSLDCGPGADRVGAGLDDFLPGDCESAAYVLSSDFASPNGPLFDLPVKVMPVASDADSATFEVPCPSPKQEGFIKGCKGTLSLESPPVPGSSAAPAVYGSAPFDLAPGASAAVKVPLDAAGQAARAADSPVAVHLKATLPVIDQNPPDHPVRADFGWQTLLPH